MLTSKSPRTLARSTDNSDWTSIASFSAATTSYVDTGLAPNTHYYYQLTAANSAGTTSTYAFSPPTASIFPGVVTPDFTSGNEGSGNSAITLYGLNGAADATVATLGGYSQPLCFAVTRNGGNMGQCIDVSLQLTGDGVYGVDYALAQPAGDGSSSFSVDAASSGSAGSTTTINVSFQPNAPVAIIELDPLNTGPRSGKSETLAAQPGVNYSLGTYNDNGGFIGYTTYPNIAPHGLAIKLDQGEAYPIITQPMTNTMSTAGLMQLRLTIPSDLPTGSTVTLINSDTWNTKLLSYQDGTLETLGTTSWTIGTSPVPTLLYVAAVEGSESMEDTTVFTLETSAASSAAHPNGSGQTVATKPATVVILNLSNSNNPNEFSSEGDINGTSQNWMVGQIAELKATLSGPAPEVAGATYDWFVPGYVDTSWSESPGGISHEVHFYSHPSFDDAYRTGVANFFWVNAGQGDIDGSSETVNVTANIRGVSTPNDKATFDVFGPSVVTDKPTPGSVLVALNTPTIWPYTDPYWHMGVDGMNLYAGVQDPEWVSPGGDWTFMQTLVPHWTDSAGTTGFALASNGKVLLDGELPLNGHRYVVFDPSLIGVSSPWLMNTLLPPDGHTYGFADDPNTSLSTNHLVNFSNGTTGIITLDRSSRSDSFMNYVMYKPVGTESQWVPLAVRPWNWSDAAVRTGPGLLGTWKDTAPPKSPTTDPLRLLPWEPQTFGRAQHQVFNEF